MVDNGERKAVTQSDLRETKRLKRKNQNGKPLIELLIGVSAKLHIFAILQYFKTALW